MEDLKEQRGGTKRDGCGLPEEEDDQRENGYDDKYSGQN